MEIKTYLLGNVLDIIEYKILMGMGGGFQVLIIHKNCIQQFLFLFFFLENLLFFWLPISSGRIQDITLVYHR